MGSMEQFKEVEPLGFLCHPQVFHLGSSGVQVGKFGPSAADRSWSWANRFFLPLDQEQLVDLRLDSS